MLRNFDDDQKEMQVEVPPSLDISPMLTCSLTKQLFFEPISASPCNHTFERYAIESSMQKQAACPCCNKPIKSLIRPPTFITDLLDATLKEQPALHKSRSFHPCYMEKRKDEQEPAFQQRQKKYRDFLLMSEFDLNKADDRPEPGGPIIYKLSSCFDGGRQFLAQHPELLDGVTANGLNAICPKDNCSVVAWLATSRDCKLFMDKIVDKISSESLNAIYNKNGCSAVYWIAKNYPVLLKNPRIRALITAQGLNTIATEHRFKDDHALHQLAKTEEGREVLFQDDQLLILVAPALWDLVPTGEEHSARWYIERAKAELLKKHPSDDDLEKLDERASKRQRLFATRGPNPRGLFAIPEKKSSVMEDLFSLVTDCCRARRK